MQKKVTIYKKTGMETDENKIYKQKLKENQNKSLNTTEKEKKKRGETRTYERYLEKDIVSVTQMAQLQAKNCQNKKKREYKHKMA